MKQVLLILTAIMLLSSCKSTKKTLGLTENIPDEFQVTKMKPLEVPPHFSLSRGQQGKIVKKSENNLSVAEKAILKESPQE
ncbi:MAG: DUF3035 domain-containing protein [Rickettsiaceae bacterium]